MVAIQLQNQNQQAESQLQNQELNPRKRLLPKKEKTSPAAVAAVHQHRQTARMNPVVQGLAESGKGSVQHHRNSRRFLLKMLRQPPQTQHRIPVQLWPMVAA
jgi:hypothetical protein